MQKEAILDGVQTQGPLRYTRVWCKRAEEWRIVAGHMSAVTAKGSTEDSVQPSAASKPRVA
jgi:hypothetical protein